MSTFGKAEPVTALCAADRTSITLRGKDFCNDVIGAMTLSSFIFFHLTGRVPSEQQAKMLDALIISIAEHGLSPTAIAARMTYSSGPEALQAAVAAGILGAGSVVLGSASEAADLIAEGVAEARRGQNHAVVARRLAERALAGGGKIPGFGHPLHKPDDPRAVRLLELSDELGVSGDHVQFLRALAGAADAVAGKHLVLNIQGPIAAIGLDLGFPPFLTRAIPILARAIGVLAHIAEESERPLGFFIANLANEAVKYRGPDGVEQSVIDYGRS